MFLDSVGYSDRKTVSIKLALQLELFMALKMHVHTTRKMRFGRMSSVQLSDGKSQLLWDQKKRLMGLKNIRSKTGQNEKLICCLWQHLADTQAKTPCYSGMQRGSSPPQKACRDENRNPHCWGNEKRKLD